LSVRSSSTHACIFVGQSTSAVLVATLRRAPPPRYQASSGRATAMSRDGATWPLLSSSSGRLHHETFSSGRHRRLTKRPPPPTALQEVTATCFIWLDLKSSRLHRLSFPSTARLPSPARLLSSARLVGSSSSWLSSSRLSLGQLICKKKEDYYFVSVWLVLVAFHQSENRNTRVLKKCLPLLLLCSHRRHGFFFDFFRPCPSVALSGAFQWHQLL
jgi:hypothetical protein